MATSFVPWTPVFGGGFAKLGYPFMEVIEILQSYMGIYRVQGLGLGFPKFWCVFWSGVPLDIYIYIYIYICILRYGRGTLFWATFL